MLGAAGPARGRVDVDRRARVDIVHAASVKFRTTMGLRWAQDCEGRAHRGVRAARAICICILVLVWVCELDIGFWGGLQSGMDGHREARASGYA